MNRRQIDEEMRNKDELRDNLGNIHKTLAKLESNLESILYRIEDLENTLSARIDPTLYDLKQAINALEQCHGEDYNA